MSQQKFLKLLTTTALVLGIGAITSNAAEKRLLPNIDTLGGRIKTTQVANAFAELKRRADSGDVDAKTALSLYPNNSEQAVRQYDTYKVAAPHGGGHASGGGGSSSSSGGKSYTTDELDEIAEDRGLAGLKDIYNHALGVVGEASKAQSTWKGKEYKAAILELQKKMGTASHTAASPTTTAVPSSTPASSTSGPAERPLDTLSIAELEALINDIADQIQKLYEKGKGDWDPEVKKLLGRQEAADKELNKKLEEGKKAEEKAAKEKANAERKEKMQAQQAAWAAETKKAYEDIQAAPATPLRSFILLVKNDFLNKLDDLKKIGTEIKLIEAETDENTLKALLYTLGQLGSADLSTQTRRDSVSSLTQTAENQLRKIGKGAPTAFTKAKGVPTTAEEQQDFNSMVAFYKSLPDGSDYKKQINNGAQTATVLAKMLNIPIKVVKGHNVTDIKNSIGGSNLTLFEWKAIKAAVKMGEAGLELNHLEIKEIVNKIDESIEKIKTGSTKLNENAKAREKAEEDFKKTGIIPSSLTTTHGGSAPTSSSRSGVPTPPPPPPPGGPMPPPPPPPPSGGPTPPSSGGGGTGGAPADLLDAIRKGTTLKKTGKNPTS